MVIEVARASTNDRWEKTKCGGDARGFIGV
jgi:hypothetical protein